METFYLNGFASPGNLVEKITLPMPSRKVSFNFYKFVVGFFRDRSFVVKYECESEDNALSLIERDRKSGDPTFLRYYRISYKVSAL